MASRSQKKVIIGSIMAILIVGILVVYFNYRINLVQKDYNEKLLQLARQTKDGLEKTQEQLGALGLNLTSQIGVIDTSLQSFKKENQKQINTLNDLIDQIEQQSNIRLNELKDELKNIQIKSADFSAIVNDVLKSVVSIQTNVGQGSGVIISSKGYVVTNVHVISGATSVFVSTFDERSYQVTEVVGYDPGMDIVVLKVSASNLKPLSFGDSDDLKIGERVIAAGNPAGLAFTVTEGIVSALRLLDNGVHYVQTDVPINPGNSGGPLINNKGEIVGINNFKIKGSYEGLGFAIAANDVRGRVNKMISDYEARQKQ